MTLLDTNAVIWLLIDHPRAQPLVQSGVRLYLSPVSLLELQFLVEVGRLPEPEGGVGALARDSRWALDNPASDLIFKAALEVAWTRDPFDRLLVGHARCRRFRLATGDRHLLGRVPDAFSL